ncbi:TPA: hypothetical protein N0F65_011409 [Lagenidium giganteum]|uniref:tRNA-splicing endonuclease subunit Sen54 N-terminal domain-containing protein n=1 Tax=Lagenidium giganteum TaxID=4803 RepID=A0AAV2Z7V8_9STRA|nr:TPA: hypothetical protein N0F65_011409 [Lagenidium giganteum]
MPESNATQTIGEYDAATGLTYITKQRGRLLFNMGAKAQRPKELPVLQTGKFTGQALYAEEAFFLLRRGALALYDRQSNAALSTAAFASIFQEDHAVSLPCLAVYEFLKLNKLHPRRHEIPMEPISASADADAGGLDTQPDSGANAAEEPSKPVVRSTYCEPKHYVRGSACSIAFDVWKSCTTMEVPAVKPPPTTATTAPSTSNDATAAPATTMLIVPAKRPKKRLQLVFRVIVCQYHGHVPSPMELARVVEDSEGIPVKIATVHEDNSVLLFELS